MTYLKVLGKDPAKIDVFPVRCTADNGRCRQHLATVVQETVGRVLRIDPGPKGYVVLDVDHERTFSRQRFFDIHCQKHDGYVFTVAGDVDTVFSDGYRP